MKTNRTSFTALGIALLRALESARPADERVCYDPFARRFIPLWMWVMGRFFDGIGYSERRGPGVVGFLAARERAIDEALLAGLGPDVRQVVLLGAGYDARAYRLDALRSVTVFEVDQPSTQAEKVRKLKAILPQGLPGNVRFVPLDFNRQSLEQGMYAAGYDPAARNLFVWQGVIYYLASEAVDATLAFIAGQSAPGSRLIFDYAEQEYLSGSHGEVRNTNRYGRITGEKLVFGIPAGGLEAFLMQRGFRLLADYGARELHELYFTGKRAKRSLSPGYSVAVAEVIR